ncbi:MULTISPECIES: UbiH/UbiF/VisC/COQ6 family ubiquinone biosynthesis hydroxylase [unclassified Brevundimonas]|jgi:2-octaprenyl-6-methoxyphenol hydroxylase|uniref:UbiH/UbiF/VisC/COQ6 family ubiquinone biosynthesis hydroxylase n=1 Tax=unclassified Brevundimonas TaxID=2622653 RepID=UPI000C6AB9AC|nr:MULTISPECIES: UbiH/UbiF/VisC/COQ6 family ubiquinone biosynthesis hydroxylase [unclassified Brevundimonas]MAL88323.1 2-octaprenyl-6-methoxyphenyl hydroxylase [Brevundimonas sp.]|tara:strand:- start:44 stop:1297 length:1254 start_codon:yes stop_codon:yes gene_type:complete
MSDIAYTDVLIAGAGLAGASLALALSREGFEVTLVDPQPFEAQLAPTFDGRSTAIAFSTYRMLHTLGLGQDLAPHACRMDRILVTDGRRPGASAKAPDPAYLRFDADEIGDATGGEPLGYMIENRRLRVALARALGETDVTIRAPVGVSGVETGLGRSTVTLSDGSQVRAALVVGAEGRRSVVRDAAGIGVIRQAYGQSGVVATVRLAAPHEGVAHEYFLPGGPFAILPLTDQRASLVWTEPTRAAEALRGASDAAFLSHLNRRFGDFLGTARSEGPRFVYPLDLSLATAMVAPRIALIGDAAHGVHPVAGQGLNMGLKDVAALTEVLADARLLGEDIGAEPVLDRYAQWRRFDTVALTLAFDAFVRLFSNDIAPVRAVRDLGMAAVNRIAPLRRAFMHEAGGATGDLPKLLRGEAV